LVGLETNKQKSETTKQKTKKQKKWKKGGEKIC